MIKFPYHCLFLLVSAFGSVIMKISESYDDFIGLDRGFFTLGCKFCDTSVTFLDLRRCDADAERKAGS